MNKDVSITSIDPGARWGRVSETEISGADFDSVLTEAEALVKRIKRIDFMASPSIVSKTRDEAGNWRMRVRSYTID